MSTIPFTSPFPSLVFVCPSNCGSGTFTLTIAVNPSLKSSPVKDIFSLFLKLKKLKKTIIFATHNRELANRADYKLFISDGVIKRVNALKR